MAPVDGSMDMLSQAVLSEAQTEAEQILSSAQARADEVRQRAQAQAEAERRAILERAKEEAERIRRQATATVQIGARAQKLERREKLLNKVFNTAREQLPTVQQWSDYDQIASQLLREALIHLESTKARVRADKLTRQVLEGPSLETLAKELNVGISFGEMLAQGTGVIVETEDGRRRYDNTLETRLSRMQDALRSPTYHLLIGESL